MSISLQPALEQQKKNESVVGRLYAALLRGDAKAVRRRLAKDLEWWFHGPPHCQYLMRRLTGDLKSDGCAFKFNPQYVTAVGNKVFVEGREDGSLYWIHVWTVENGISTQVREYFNTWLVATELKEPCLPLWQSKLEKSKANSMPELVLAI